MEKISPTDFEVLNVKVDRIYEAMIGSDIGQDGGIVKRLQRLESKVDELTEFKNKSKWTASLLIGVATLFAFFIDKIIGLFHK